MDTALEEMPVVPMPLMRLPQPFDLRDWLYEIKHDGFARNGRGHRCRLTNRIPVRITGRVLEQLGSCRICEVNDVWVIGATVAVMGSTLTPWTQIH